MNLPRVTPHLASLKSFILIFFAAVLLSSCSQKFNFNKSSVVPSAEGKVTVKTDNNKNYNIKLKVEHLAEPSRLTPSHSTYVVWMKTRENGTRNIGHLNVSSGMLSSKLKASMETVSPHKPTGFFITAEDAPDSSYPGWVVMETETK